LGLDETSQRAVMSSIPSERHETVVIGAGQSGLAVGHELARRNIDFVILEASERIGDNWRSRWDSLKLYSPAGSDALPGMAFPAPRGSFPHGRQMGDYLESYAERFHLPIRLGVKAESLRFADAGYVITAGGQAFEAAQVVVATGAFRRPNVPTFAGELDPAIRQLHSSDYQRPSQLAEGAVLVVGLSHSVADIALEAAREHQTFLSGRSHGELPFSIESRRGRLMFPIMKFVATHLLTMRTPIGRRMASRIRAGGAPLLRVRAADLRAAGVEHIEARTVGARDGKPMLADGRALDVANVVWCTGFRPDYGWIQLPVVGADGWPDQTRGVATAVPGLYFLGVPFLTGFTSVLVFGAGRDAAYVARRIVARAGMVASSPGPRAAGASGNGASRAESI
jgi:putative flavoprotein involved in K+ transport